MRDLELRLGLTADPTPPPVRVARYATRLAHITPRFWSASLAKDPLGTARAILAWRDELVLSGWDGRALGPDRLNALAEVEAIAADIPALPAGIADRWAAVNALLESSKVPYKRVRLVDDRARFPARLQRALDQLRVLITTQDVPHVPFVDTDLGRLQRHLREGGTTPKITGDGTLVLLHAETPIELAGAAVAILGEGRHAIVRLSDPAPLDYALRDAGLPTQGLANQSALRPIFQVLPLALELAYEPKDPQRVLELLTLPNGPFAGLGRRLAEAFAARPGLGNADWQDAKSRWAQSVLEHDASAEADVTTRLQRLADWVEAQGSITPRAPRDSLLEVVRRTQNWLAGRLLQPDAEQAALASQAHVQASTLAAALQADPRDGLTIVEVRQLFAEALGGGRVTQLPEEAGRVDHTTDLGALLTPRDTLLLWGAIDASSAPAPSPWTPSERAALEQASVQLPDEPANLSYRARVARRALGLARNRLLIARPLTQLGQATAPHALVDEIVARLGGEGATIAKITRSARDVLASSKAPTLSELPLPAPRPEWKLPPGLLERRAHLSPSTIETLVGCPLRFVLEKKAGLRDASVVSLADGPILFGSLGHRLVERLHEQGLLGHGTKKDRAALRIAAHTTLDQLLREDATVLLAPGRSNDLAQLRAQLVETVDTLDGMLRDGKLTVVSVEEELTVEWDARSLDGRLDLLLADDKGRDFVLDLKWGSSTYEKKLAGGVAIQLATYAFVRSKQNGKKVMPSAGYYSLRKGEAMALSNDVIADARVIQGPELQETWKQTEASIAAVEADLAAGRIAVPGNNKDTPAWRSVERMSHDAERYVPIATDAACEYCAHNAVCGRRWTLADGGAE